MRFRLPWTFSTFDYRELCGLLYEQCDAEFETAKVEGRARQPTGDRRRSRSRPTAASFAAPLVVDALGWKRVLAGSGYQPPEAPLSRGLEVHPFGAGDELEIWIDRDYVPAGYWLELSGRATRSASASGRSIPRFHVKEPTVRLAADLERDAVRYQGNWIPHKLRSATGDGVFFVGDSAGHCLPLTAEGIRTAFYFGIACGRELRRVVEGRADPATALRRYRGFSAPTSGSSSGCCGCRSWSRGCRRGCWPRLCGQMERDSFVGWSFGHYLRIAHPSFATPSAPDGRARAAASSCRLTRTRRP